MAEATLGRRKASDGIQAVQWFRDGQWELLIDYCRKDVILTKDLLNHALKEKFLLYSDRQGRKLRIPTAWDLKNYLNDEAVIKF